MKLLSAAGAVVMALTIAGGPHAETSGADLKVLRIKQTMTESEFKNCGLSRLLPGELEALDRWLSAYTHRLNEAARAGQAVPPSAIESHIEGKFEGWKDCGRL